MELNELRKKIIASVDTTVDPIKISTVSRTGVIYYFGILQTALLPLLDGKGYNKDVVETTISKISKELITECAVYDIKEQDLDRAFEGISKEKEKMPFGDSQELFESNIFTLHSYLSGEMDNIQVLIYLKGLSLFLDIDLEASLNKII